MNLQNKKLQISLSIPPWMWREFKQALLTLRKQQSEVIGFFFCERHQVSKNKVRYLPRTWIVPSEDCYELQAFDKLVLKQSFHFYLLNTYVVKENLTIVHIHTHPSLEKPSFSLIDDYYEREYAQFLSTIFKNKPYLISGVFDQVLEGCNFRIWSRDGKQFKSVQFSSAWFHLFQENSNNYQISSQFERQKLFGQTFQKQLNTLTVSLIGCGGIGSIFAELLGRLGVKQWLLIDPDKLEESNLNRMVAATSIMTQQQWDKVHYVKKIIKQIYSQESSVKTRNIGIENESIHTEVAASDLIVVATDNHYSRKIAQQIAIKYQRPIICLGTHIEVKTSSNSSKIRTNEYPRMYCRITIPPLGGNWCLMCGNIINLQQAAVELSPNKLQEMVAKRGYLEGINNPSVFWLNSICASTAVGIIHSMISGFININEGLDWIYHFPGSDWLKTDVSLLSTSDCYFCGSG